MKKKKMKKKDLKITLNVPNFKLCWVSNRELEFGGRIINIDHKSFSEALESAQSAILDDNVVGVTITAEMRAVPFKKGRK